MKYAARLLYEIDVEPLKDSELIPLRTYGKVQRYGKNLPGDHAAQVASGWVAQNKSVSNADCFINQLPDALLKLERPYVIILDIPAFESDNPVLPAHRDYNKTCGINVYLETNGEVTKFYHWNRGTQQSDFVEEFCADTGEIWAMNTDVPHSVVLTPNKPRRMLSFCFSKLPYTEVISCFATK